MFDAYLQIEGIPGECTAAGFEGMIEIQSFSHGVSQELSPSTSTAGGSTGGRCNHGDFAVTKVVDKSTPLLVLKCCEGSHLPKVTLTLVRAGGAQKVPYMIYVLSDVIVSSVAAGGGIGSFPTEAVSFNYTKIEWTYTQQKPDGTPGGKVAGAWDLTKHK